MKRGGRASDKKEELGMAPGEISEDQRDQKWKEVGTHGRFLHFLEKGHSKMVLFL